MLEQGILATAVDSSKCPRTHKDQVSDYPRRTHPNERRGRLSCKSLEASTCLTRESGVAKNRREEVSWAPVNLIAGLERCRGALRNAESAVCRAKRFAKTIDAREWTRSCRFDHVVEEGPHRGRRASRLFEERIHWGIT